MLDPHKDGHEKERFASIGRRGYLRGTATALAAATGVGVISGTAYAQEPEVDANVSGDYTFNDHGDHYEYVVDPGGNVTFGVDFNGAIVQNVLIDITASGASANIQSHFGWWATPPSDFTIRNVGVRGQQPNGGGFVIIPSTSGSATVENVYLGDGAAEFPSTEHEDTPGAIILSPESSGTVHLSEVYMRYWIDNAYYASAPADVGGYPTWEPQSIVQNCYAMDNSISGFRLTGGDEIYNSYAGTTDNWTQRGLWAYAGGGTVHAENCEFENVDGGFPVVVGDGTNVDMVDSSYGNWTGGGTITEIGDTDRSPSEFVPAGCPTGPDEAATGDDDSIVGDDDAHYFEIAGPGEFYLEVDQEVEPDPSIEEWTEYGETHGDDWVGFELSETGETYWWYKHDIVQLDYTDDQTVWIDGEEYDDGVTVVEDFERSDPLAEYGGRTDLFGTTSSGYEGSQALVNDGGDFGSVASTSGLSNYPERGDEVHVHFDNAGDDNFLAFHLFAQSETDNPDSYSVGISAAGAWRMWRHDGGDLTQLASEDLPSSEQISGWYRAEISSDSSTVYADLYDAGSDDLLASIQADDTTYTSGGIGFRSAGNGEVFDYVIRPD